MRKKTQDEFIAECIALNGDLHLLDRVDYKGAHVKVWIGCKVEGHGYWPVTPANYLSRGGCPKCAGKNKTTTEFIVECRALNGDLHLLDRVDYKNGKTHVEIGCRVEGHGYWPVTPSEYLGGSGCPKCANAMRADRQRSNTEEFIAKAKKMAGADNHLFDRVDYKNNNTKVSIGCKTEGHGYWPVTPGNYLSNKGCPKCARDKSAAAKLSNTGEFIAKAKKMAGADNHLFDRVDYKNNSTKVSIGCKTGGHEYWPVTPSGYLGGSGCPKCAHAKSGDRCRSNTEEFIAKAKKMAGADNHLFDQVDYKNDSTNVSIGCKTEGHGYWPVTPRHYLQRSGCPSCRVHGIKLTQPGRLYYLRVTTPTGACYKIGITNHTVAKRYKGRDLKNIEIIDEITYEKCADAHAAEQLILRHFSTMRRDHDRGNPVLACGGNTELLLDDVLGVGDLQRMITACLAYDTALQLAS